MEMAYRGAYQVRSERWSVPPLASRGSDVWPGILSPAIRSTISIIYLAPGGFDADLPPQIACHRTRVSSSASAHSSLLCLLAWLWSGPRPRDHSPARSAPFGAAAAAHASSLIRLPS